MTLEPQKAQIKKQATEKAEDKRVRRIAPEYTLVWSDAAWKVVNARSGTTIKDVSAAAYERIWRAEAALCGALDIVTIVPMPGMDTFDKWWTPFKVGKLWFVLRYEDKPIREYHVEPAMGPAPDDGGDQPEMTRRQKTPPPKHVAPKSRAKKTGGAKGARPASVRRPPKQTERVFSILYNFVEIGGRFAWDGFNNRYVQLQRRFKPRLLRSFVLMRRLGGTALRALRAESEPLVQMFRDFAVLALTVRASFTGAREVAIEKAGPGARLEPRCAGQNIGLHLLLYSWIWDEPPVDWSSNLVGALPIDWTANLFGVLPEEERVFT